MGLKIKRETLCINIPLILILLMTYLNTTIIRIRYRYCFFIILISSVLLIINTFLRMINEKKKLVRIDLLLGGMLFFVLIRNKDFLNNDWTYCLIFIAITVLCIFNKKCLKNCCNIFMKFSYIWGLLACIFTFICYIFPEFYITNIFKILPDELKLELLYCFEKGYISGFALQYSSNAIYLSMFCGIVFGKLLCKNGKKSINIVLLILGCIALFLTAKRAHVVFSIIAMLIVYYIYNSDKKKSRMIKIAGILIIAICVFIISASIIPEIKNVFYRFLISIDSKDGLFDTRVDLYRYAITVFKGNPIFGCGWSGYKYLAEQQLGTYIAVHNVYLQLLAEIGIVGAILFYAFFVISLIISCRCLKRVSICKKNLKKDDSEIIIFSLFFIIFFLTYSITGNSLYETNFIIPYLSCPVYCMFVHKNSLKGERDGM